MYFDGISTSSVVLDLVVDLSGNVQHRNAITIINNQGNRPGILTKVSLRHFINGLIR